MQTASAVAMVRPAAFTFNEETAASNYFQCQPDKQDLSLQQKAIVEFDTLVTLLRDNNVDVLVMEDDGGIEKPDAIFPNNWFCCNNNRLTVFPICAVNRRPEKRPELIEIIQKKTGISSVKDLSENEKENIFLEGTGSMVIDHSNRLIYACISARTDKKLLAIYAADNNYEAVIFEAADDQGRDIYHTNVLMCIGAGFAVICADAINEKYRAEVSQQLSESGHELVLISFEQMKAFAGNMLQLINDNNELLLVMSNTAFRSLLPTQINIIEKYSRLLIADVSTIESASGGSVRCMMAELFY